VEADVHNQCGNNTWDLVAGPRSPSEVQKFSCQSRSRSPRRHPALPDRVDLVLDLFKTGLGLLEFEPVGLHGSETRLLAPVEGMARSIAQHNC